MIENTHTMFRDLSVERGGGKDWRIGSLESFGGKGEIKIHCILRDFSVNVDLPPLSCFFRLAGKRRTSSGLDEVSSSAPPFFPRCLEEENRRTLSSYFEQIVYQKFQKTTKKKPDLDPNLLKRSSWPLPDGNECR